MFKEKGASLESCRYSPGPVFSYKVPYIAGFRFVEMAISTNQKPTIYRNLYDNTGPDHYDSRSTFQTMIYYYRGPWYQTLCRGFHCMWNPRSQNTVSAISNECQIRRLSCWRSICTLQDDLRMTLGWPQHCSDFSSVNQAAITVVVNVTRRGWWLLLSRQV